MDYLEVAKLLNAAEDAPSTDEHLQARTPSPYPTLLRWRIALRGFFPYRSGDVLAPLPPLFWFSIKAREEEARVFLLLLAAPVPRASSLGRGRLLSPLITVRVHLPQHRQDNDPRPLQHMGGKGIGRLQRPSV